MVKVSDHIRWWQWLPLPWRKWRIVLYVEAGDAVPTRLPVRGVVLVRPGKQLTWAIFDCPCRKGHRVMLNLHSSRDPHWKIDEFKPITLSPSIDDEAFGRRCHFFLTRGRVTWARGDGGVS